MTKQLTDVFGVTVKPVLSYYERPAIDGLFQEALKSDKHIVVYGASKQGKTALVTRYLPPSQCIVVRLSPASTPLDIYQSILRKANVTVEIAKTRGTSKELSGSLSTRGVAKYIFGEWNGGFEASAKSASQETTDVRTMSVNLALPEDVSDLLKATGYKGHVVLENFHYLSEATQRLLAVDLRTFQDTEVRFAILGVWRQKDKLRVYCPDLTDRVIDVAVEPWTEQDFRHVAQAGADHLKVSLTNELLQGCVENSYGSIGVFQELIKHVCLAAGLDKEQRELTIIDNSSFLSKAIEIKAQEYGVTHRQALELIASGNITFSKNKPRVPLFLPYYLVKAIIETGPEKLRNGIDKSEVIEAIKRSHHRADDVRPTDINNLLDKLGRLQQKKGISPPLIEYDKGRRRLYAVDSTLFFFLEHCDAADLVSEIPSPLAD